MRRLPIPTFISIACTLFLFVMGLCVSDGNSAAFKATVIVAGVSCLVVTLWHLIEIRRWRALSVVGRALWCFWTLALAGLTWYIFQLFAHDYS